MASRRGSAGSITSETEKGLPEGLCGLQCLAKKVRPEIESKEVEASEEFANLLEGTAEKRGKKGTKPAGGEPVGPRGEESESPEETVSLSGIPIGHRVTVGKAFK